MIVRSFGIQTEPIFVPVPGKRHDAYQPGFKWSLLAGQKLDLPSAWFP